MTAFKFVSYYQHSSYQPIFISPEYPSLLLLFILQFHFLFHP